VKIEMTVDLRGLENVAERIAGAAGQRAIGRALGAGALLIENHSKRSILTGAKTGKTYRRGTVNHRASAPGQPPASDTGRLVSSFLSEPGSEPLSYDVRANAMYAGFLEFGTSRMAPRPFLRPALAATNDRIVQLVRDAIQL
jgi:HK97 gp10 family phage protein